MDHRRNRRDQQRVRMIAITAAVVVLLVAAVLGVTMGVFGKTGLFHNNEVADSGTDGWTAENKLPEPVVYNGKKYEYNDHLTNYLLLGVDTKGSIQEEKSPGSAGQSDAVFLVSYDRVKETFALVIRYAFTIGAVETACFWLFPHQILSLFGNGAGGYEDFAIRYMHEFMLLVILAGVLPVSMNTMVSIKRPQNGIIISLSKQLVLIILLLILPRSMGIDGVLAAGPIADFLVAAAAFVVIRSAFRKLDELQV